MRSLIEMRFKLDPTSPAGFALIAFAGAAQSVIVLDVLGSDLGDGGSALWLLEYPRTRRLGLVVPPLQLLLLAIPSVRRSLGPLLLGGPVVYAAVGTMLSLLMLFSGLASGNAEFALGSLFFAIMGISFSAPFAFVGFWVWNERKKSPAHIPQAALGFVVMLLIPALDLAELRSGFRGAIVEQLEAASPGDLVDFRQLNPKPWSRLLIFGWYTRSDEIDRALGYRWDDRRRESVHFSEGHHLFVFVGHDGQVGDVYEIGRGAVDFCPKLHSMCLNRAEAQLRVAKGRAGDNCIAQAQTSTSACEQAPGGVPRARHP